MLNTDINKIINVEDSDLNKRKGSLFIETNPEYIKNIIEFI